MSKILIFAGSSCPALTTSICSKLGMTAAPLELSKFANGETSVKILTSIREMDVFVVQSGSSKINDSIMELLILISACKGGSANKITAVLPYFPYSRQSKKKSHRGSITARMLANLLTVAGVHHVVTVDLHGSQMQGFFKCPVDNLHAEPLISRWIRHNVPNWNKAVCISKNAGGTKRVTSLADALKLNFGMITTDKNRGVGSSTFPAVVKQKLQAQSTNEQDLQKISKDKSTTENTSQRPGFRQSDDQNIDLNVSQVNTKPEGKNPRAFPSRVVLSPKSKISSPLEPSDDVSQLRKPRDSPVRSFSRTMSSPTLQAFPDEEHEFTDERARDIIQGRLVHGHVVPDDYPSPSLSSISASTIHEQLKEVSVGASQWYSPDTKVVTSAETEQVEANSDDEEENFKNTKFEHMITLVGDVSNRTVFIIDDMIDKAGSWIAAAECVVKRGGAQKVYCIATHGLFGGNSLEELQNCDCIDTIVVTNSFPIPAENALAASKLVILDMSSLLSEAIRRNHYGESMSALFTHSFD